MTKMLFRDDPYLRSASATVVATDAESVTLDQSLFYPQGGGQPGDTGWIQAENLKGTVTNSVKGDGDAIRLLVENHGFSVGQTVTQTLDWDRRFAHMRVHSGLHLLSVVIQLPVTGGAITAVKGRLDFNMPEALTDKEALQDQLNALIAQDLEITESWITDAELEANPGLVKTMSVAPPKGAGHIRLIRIGDDDQQIDLQPCGGTHVARTSEIGQVTLGKVEKKGAQNRRVNMLLA